MDYSALKHSHAGLAYLTIILFVVRFLLFSVAPKWRTNKVLKIAPHIIDTLLLVFALMMVFSTQFGLSHGWLTAKVVGLIIYIGFGVVAIRKANKAAFAGALVTYAYVFGVAKYKTALSFLVLFS